MIQNKMNNLDRYKTLMRGVTMFLFMLNGVASAGDLTALSWEENTAATSLQVWVGGSPTYEIQTLDGGQRLRLRLSDTVLRDVTDVEGRGAVKGVYPYLSDTGTGVNVDFLLTEPGQLNVESTSYGYRVTAQVGGAEAPKAEAPKTAIEKTEATATVPPAPPVKPVAVVVAPRAVSAPAAIAAEPQNAIEDIVYAKLPGDRIQIQLRMTGMPAKPAVFTTSNPARIALDFPNTRFSMAKT
ncbi:MAG: hypothetical protein AAB312_01290, partial [Pseudomonadota bacterium]